MFLGASTQPGTDFDSVVALKRYRGDMNVERDARTPNLLIHDHPGVVKSRLLRSTSGMVWLVERLWTGSLYDLVTEGGPVRDIERLFEMATQLFDGLQAIHATPLRHTDIKPENCGILQFGRQEPQYVIGDFGCVSPNLDVVPAHALGTLKTRAPELFERPRRIGLGSDVWALGATLYAVAVREYPFMPFDIELGELDDPRRREIEEHIGAELAQRMMDFRARVGNKLPPCLSGPLERCFEPLGSRPAARQIHAALAAAQSAFKESVRPGARFAWQRAQDLIALHKKLEGMGADMPQGILDEARTLVTDFGQEIPPELQAHLRGIIGL